MKTLAIAHKTVFGTLALSLACIFALNTSSASAAERFEHDGYKHSGVNVNIGLGEHRGWDHDRFHGDIHFDAGHAREGYYETVTEHVLVTPAHNERRWIEPAYRANVCVHDGFWQDVVIPAHYEDRHVRVWHAGYRECIN